MQYTKVTAKEVNGLIREAFATSQVVSWIDPIAMKADSTSQLEKYGWLGNVPKMIEWVGPRLAKAMLEKEYILRNKLYQNTMTIFDNDLNRDKIGILKQRIAELPLTATENWEDQLTAAILAGAATKCYDGQYFFDTDHSEGDSGTLKNVLTSSEVPALDVTLAAPTVDEMAKAVLGVISYMMAYKDDTCRQVNRHAKSWQVQVGLPLFFAPLFEACTSKQIYTSGGTRDNPLPLFNVVPVLNSGLSSLTAQMIVMRTDSNMKPFIMQSETQPQIETKDESSDFHFDNHAIQVGVNCSRAVGYGLYQFASYATLS